MMAPGYPELNKTAPGSPCAQSCAQSHPTWPPRPVARQAPQSMGFSRQEYWSGLPFSSLEVHHLAAWKYKMNWSDTWYGVLVTNTLESEGRDARSWVGIAPRGTWLSLLGGGREDFLEEGTSELRPGGLKKKKPCIWVLILFKKIHFEYAKVFLSMGCFQRDLYSKPKATEFKQIVNMLWKERQKNPSYRWLGD